MTEEEPPKKKKVEKSKHLNFKHWVTRTVMVGMGGIAVFFLFDYLFHFNILNQSLIALFVSLFLGLLHEFMHFIIATRLGYKVIWFRTRFTMGFEIEHASVRGKRDSPEKIKALADIKKIAYAPYYVVVPLSCVLFVCGYFMISWGLEVAGAFSLLFHTVMFSKEGLSE